MCVEKENAEENEEEEWKHPPSSCTHESNFSHTLNFLFYEAMQEKDVASWILKNYIT